MLKSSIRVLIVEDFEGWRRFYCSTLQKHSEFQVIGEVSDGLEAVHQARQLQPDLILLDIGLPTLNGIEAARRIRKISAASKILFVSECRSDDVVREALSTGPGGYVLKSDAGDLLPAINAVLEGKRFVSASLIGLAVSSPPNQHTADHLQRDKAVTVMEVYHAGSVRQHEAEFCSDEGTFLGGFARFIGTALTAGKAVIVVATGLHRDSLLPRLQSHGLDIGAAIKAGRYISLDAVDTLSTFMVDGSPDPVRFQKAARDLIMAAAKAVNGDPARVAACGEGTALLWAQGNLDAAIRLEHLWDEIAITYRVDILCAYSLSSFQGDVGHYAFDKICSAHSAVYSR